MNKRLFLLLSDEIGKIDLWRFWPEWEATVRNAVDFAAAKWWWSSLLLVISGTHTRADLRRISGGGKKEKRSKNELQGRTRKWTTTIYDCICNTDDVSRIAIRRRAQGFNRTIVKDRQSETPGDGMCFYLRLSKQLLGGLGTRLADEIADMIVRIKRGLSTCCYSQPPEPPGI